MLRGEAFADVFERELRRLAFAPETTPAGSPRTAQTVPINPFVFVNQTPVTVPSQTLRPAGAVAGPVTVLSSPQPEPAPTPPAAAAVPAGVRTRVEPRSDRKPARILMARERRALRELIALGADLHADFTASELRRAFRILARRYHPDSHPHLDEATKARLALTFAGVAESYRCLAAAVEPVGQIRH